MVPANIPSLESSYFVTNGKLKGSWLAVVNVDRQNVIHWSSNGCGIARDYCLAAPGTGLLSTFVRGDLDDVKHQGSAAEYRQRFGDVNLESGDGYGTYTGTSMAAPVVSGALAVVKSGAPTLSTQDAVKILLCTATDLDGPVRKSVEECALKGPEARHDNGWQPSDVYGHGLVNLERALQPVGLQQAVDGTGLAVAASADTRIAFSSVFGDTAPAVRHDFGGLDSYGRVYRYRAPFEDRILPGPRLSGVLAVNAQTALVMISRQEGRAAYLQSSAAADSAIGEGSALGIIGARGRVDLVVARRRNSSVLSPGALLSGDDGYGVAAHGPERTWPGEHGGYDWGMLAPQSRDLVSSGGRWQLSSRLNAGAYFSRWLADGATEDGESYGMTDFGVSADIGSASDGITFHLGRLSEDGRFLGSMPEGGYALAGPTLSDYLRLSAEHRLGRRLSVGMDVMQLRARVDFRHDGFVPDTRLSAHSASAHLALTDTGRAGDRLVLHYGEPLAVTRGVIRQNSMMGYTDAGSYRATTTNLDLAVRARQRMMQVMYRVPLADGITGFAAGAHHRNWSHQRGLDNSLVMLGLSVRR